MKAIAIKTDPTSGEIMTAENINLSVDLENQSISINFRKNLKLADGSNYAVQDSLNFTNGTVHNNRPFSPVSAGEITAEDQAAIDAKKAAAEKALAKIQTAVAEFLTANQ